MWHVADERRSSMQQAWAAKDRQGRRGATREPGSRAVPYQPRSRKVSRKWGLRFLATCLLWLALLASPAPQMWSFLVSDLPRLAGTALHDAATWANHTVARIPDRIQLLADPREQHIYWQ